MTAQDIFQIVSTVAVVQCICDVIAHYAIYRSKSYQLLLDQLARCKTKLLAAQNKLKIDEKDAAITSKVKDIKGNNKKQANNATNKQVEKNQKLVQKLEQDHANLLSTIAIRHTMHSGATAVIFLILMRIFGAEHKGHIIAVLPFVPYKIVQRITLRGLQFDPSLFSGDSSIVEQLLEDVITKSRSSSGTISGVNDIGQVASFTFIYMLTTMSVKYYTHQFIATKPPAGADSLSSIAESSAGQAILKDTIGMDLKDLKDE
jgi:hypothetical protein